MVKINRQNRYKETGKKIKNKKKRLEVGVDSAADVGVHNPSVAFVHFHRHLMFEGSVEGLVEDLVWV